MRRLLLAVAGVFLLTFPASALTFPASAQTFSALVVGVTDGDTLRVLREKKEIRIRVWGIDAPERKQPFGTRAKQYASDLAYRKTVTIHGRGKDRYRRFLASIVLPDGRDFGFEMVKAGMAWWYRRYAADEGALALAEDEARREKRGLWADKEPVPPWKWRRREK